MDEHNLIESFDSAQNLVDAIQINQNIKNIKALTDSELTYYDSYGLNPAELIQQFMDDKDVCINLAIKHAYDKSWTVQMFGLMYPLQIKEFQKNISSTVAEVGSADLKRQMGVE